MRLPASVASEVAIDTVRIGLTYRIGGPEFGWMR